MRESDRLPSADNSQRRIIVTGASGVGKTTLVEKIAPELGLPVIPELARTLCQQLGYARIGEIPDQEGFKRSVIASQIEHEERLGSFVSDRSTIDCWVLWQRWNICSAMTYDSESYYQTSFEQAKKYTHIIYVPAMFAPVEDGFRWTEPDYQKQIDRMVRSTLYDWQLLDKTYEVTSEATDKRCREVLTWLNRS